jgi:hypothetical protein
MEGLEDHEVMRREEEANFHHIETDTEYNCNGGGLSLVYGCELKFIRNILPFLYKSLFP